MSDQEKTYNGWANRETWQANMWLTADPSGEMLIQEAKEQEGGICAQADWLADQVREILGLNTDRVGLDIDMLNSSLNAVNWIEIIQDN